MQMIPQETQNCVDACLRCYQTCFGMAMNHCLEQGGDHVKPKHFRAMIACADICREAVQMMLMNAPQAKETCLLCAQICEDCAKECDAIPDMTACAAECRRCAEECRRMVGHKMAA
jgi:hypothetical protein